MAPPHVNEEGPTPPHGEAFGSASGGGIDGKTDAANRLADPFPEEPPEAVRGCGG